MVKHEEITSSRRGYLEGDFELFHLRDKKDIQFEYHYHDFNKIIVFISGKVTYLIEGKAYKLKPWDVLLVSSMEIHKPLIDSSEVYERIVIWVNQAFLDKHSSDGCNLSTCFELAANHKYNLIRFSPDSLMIIRSLFSQLEQACIIKDFGHRILKNSLFMQLIVQLNRTFIEGIKKKEPGDVEFDESIDKILNYINENLRRDLSIDSLSKIFFMSKYYLMHKFKKQTGYSIHSYITQKRLIMSASLIRNGVPLMEASLECGFGDYSSFVRAFKKMFGLSPRDYYKNSKQLEASYEEKHF